MTTVFSSHPTPHPTVFFTPNDWRNFGTLLEKNASCDWVQIKEGAEFDLINDYPTFELFPRVTANVIRQNDRVVHSEYWYILPPNNSGQLRYVIDAWSAEKGKLQPELRTVWLGEQEANDFFKHFCAERGLPVGGYEDYGFLIIYKGERVTHYQYTRAMGVMK